MEGQEKHLNTEEKHFWNLDMHLLLKNKNKNSFHTKQDEQRVRYTRPTKFEIYELILNAAIQ